MKKLLLLSIAGLPHIGQANEVCTFTSNPSGVYALDNTLNKNITQLAKKGFIFQESGAEFDLSVSIMHCQPGGACGVKLTIEPNTYPRNMLYYKSINGLSFKAIKARRLVNAVPSCEEFRKFIKNK